MSSTLLIDDREKVGRLEVCNTMSFACYYYIWSKFYKAVNVRNSFIASCCLWGQGNGDWQSFIIISYAVWPIQQQASWHANKSICTEDINKIHLHNSPWCKGIWGWIFAHCVCHEFVHPPRYIIFLSSRRKGNSLDKIFKILMSPWHKQTFINPVYVKMFELLIDRLTQWCPGRIH